MLLILVSLCGLISCVSQHKHLLVHLSCHSITKTKLGPFKCDDGDPATPAQWVGADRDSDGRSLPAGHLRAYRHEGDDHFLLFAPSGGGSDRVRVVPCTRPNRPALARPDGTRGRSRYPRPG